MSEYQAKHAATIAAAAQATAGEVPESEGSNEPTEEIPDDTSEEASTAEPANSQRSNP